MSSEQHAATWLLLQLQRSRVCRRDLCAWHNYGAEGCRGAMRQRPTARRPDSYAP